MVSSKISLYNTFYYAHNVHAYENMEDKFDWLYNELFKKHFKYLQCFAK